MKLSLIACLASLIASTFADDSSSSDNGWITYTKPLGSTTIIVTRYMGSTPLLGSQYTTETFPVTDGGAVYTEILTGYADTSDKASATSSEESSSKPSSEASTTEASSSEAPASSSSGSDSSESSSISETFTGGAKTIGLSTGGLVLIGAAFLI